ncbi:hypothetical protein [Mariniphaga sp.]|uniref:hypothetical protein n=1 Tax=Mariniphaga sp. TaxID=1954475 RepID=UPI00356297C8
MKKAVRFFVALTILISGILLVSCSKDDETPGEFYMRFKANGTLVEYTNQLGLSAGFAQSGNQYVATISGWNDASSNFSLLLYNNAPITESTFSGYSVSVDGTVGVLLAHKEKDSGAVFSSGVTADYDARVTLSEITETGVKGTFSGLIKATGQSDISITEGTFFVKRVLN